MEQYSEHKKKSSIERPVQSTAQNRNAVYLEDNRPQRSDVFQLQSANSGAVMQFASTKKTGKKNTSGRKRKTISGHGKLRRDKNKIRMYKVPKGKTIMRPAPPGATLGDISMVLNEKKGLDRAELLKMLKVSTTSDFWKNKRLVALVRSEGKIVKTPLQQQLLVRLEKEDYDDLTGPQKTSLSKLESKPAFEEWAKEQVEGHAFKTFGEGQEIEDMEFSPFEKHLKSSKSHDENEYVSKKTVLSSYVDSGAHDDYTVNACSYDENCDFTGFQLDHNKK